EITLDANAITRLGQLMSRHGVNYLELQFVRLDRISDDRRKNFAGLIGTSGVRFLEMNGLDHPCAGGIFNEQFMIDMANTHLERLYSDVTPNGSFPYRFKPSKAILPALCRLQCFDVPSMVLKSDWTVELIMNYLNNYDSSLNFLDFSWKFTVDSPLTVYQIKDSMSQPQYKDQFLPYFYERSCYIMKRSN
ncbi:hypothetical protein PENTCL1PPCAC_18724, partial [Pristionchus entomophagus]